MKAILVLSVLLVGAFCATSIEKPLMKEVFAQWKLAHKKVYKAGLEEELRFNIFLQNYMTILDHNQAQSSVVLGLNQFADLTTEEFTAMYTGFKGHAGRKNNATIANYTIGDIPAKVDWREEGAVSGVKDQGQCASCWAFSAVGALEGLNFLEKHTLQLFSEQQLVDCDPQSDGCDGGLMTWAFQYTAQNGIELGTDYPYVAKTQKCSAVSSKSVKINNSFLKVEPQNVDALKGAIAGRPVSVGIQANQAVFQFYRTGVILVGCGDDLNHGVLAVGYDTFAGGFEAFIVKNSWGVSWGNKGYVLISTNKEANHGNGVCGILADSCYSTKFH